MPFCSPPTSEYGYAIGSVYGPQQVSIQTKNITEFPTSTVTVKASYLNGTAAADASISASVVGEWYYWWGPNSSIVMYSQTDKNGIAHLVLPSAPSVVTAWKWLQIFAPKNQSSVETNIGGQKVNLTIYWQPTYVGLSGSDLLVPPQNSVNLTLRYQQPGYWVMAPGTTSKGAYVNGAPSATVASQPNGTPSLAPNTSEATTSSQYYLPSQIPTIQQTGITLAPSNQPSLGGIDGLVAVSALFIVILLAIAVAAKRSNPRRSPKTGE
jgi:hypothetical protein